jgi:hypothetical protein
MQIVSDNPMGFQLRKLVCPIAMLQNCNIVMFISHSAAVHASISGHSFACSCVLCFIHNITVLPTVTVVGETELIGWNGEVRNMTCVGQGLPLPTVNWLHRGGQHIVDSDTFTIFTSKTDSTVNATLQVPLTVHVFRVKRNKLKKKFAHVLNFASRYRILNLTDARECTELVVSS